MSFSFQVPVAALSQHQSRIEIISENIANLNTPGYKGNRMTFMETLGTVSGVSQFEFKQGTITSTGKTTDLAIRGDSFFTLKDQNANQMFSRSGALELDQQGRLVNVDGLEVQGWMRDIKVENPIFAKNMSGIVIDSNLTKPGKATDNVWLSGNLNSGIESVKEVWENASALSSNDSLISSTGVTVPLSIVTGSNDELNISLNGAAAETVTLASGSYNSIDNLVTQLNTKFASNSNLYGKVSAYNAGGVLQIRNTGGTEGNTLAISAGTNDVLGSLGIAAGTSTYRVPTTTTEINSLLQVTTAFVAGDILTISGKDADGNNVSTDFTYGTDGTTVNDLLTTMNTCFAGSGSAELSDGKMMLTDLLSGNSNSSISITAASANTGQINIPTFTNTAEGFTAKVTSSVIVYDSFGNSHNVTIDLIKPDNSPENYGKWNWEASVAGDENIVSGGTGTIEFDTTGNLVSFNYDGGVDSLSVDPVNGSNLMKIKLQADSYGEYSGITQYNTVSSVEVREQDGLSAGKLNGIKVDTEGNIVASFTNGQEDTVAILAMAKFTNPSGLEKIGGGNFKQTANSGVANIAKISTQNSEIISESLETSTMDLADQFAKLIEAQNAYQAAAKVVNTYEEVADQAVRLKR